MEKLTDELIEKIELDITRDDLTSHEKFLRIRAYCTNCHFAIAELELEVLKK